MGQISIPGEISGRAYNFVIAGDRPTADEQARIDAILRQQELDFAAQYQERFGENLLPGRGLGAQIGEFFQGIPRGVGGIFETAGLGLATPFSEETELGLREGIRSLGQGLQGRFAPAIGQEDMVGGRLGEAVGSMLGIAGVGAGTTLATAPVAGPAAPFIGFGAAGALGAAAGAGEASERARAAGATQEERNLAARLGVLPGAAEMIPLVRLSRVLDTGGLRERLVRAALTGGEEGAQEAASNIAQNLIEQGVYNPEQGTFTDTGEALGYGAGAGALIQALLDLALPGRLRGGREEPPAAEPEQLPPLALPPPSAEERVATPPVIQVPPTGPEQRRDQPGINVPALRAAPGAVEPGAQAQAATEPETGAAPAAPTVRRAEEPSTAPATPMGRADMERILDELGVSQRAAIRKAVTSGNVHTVEDFSAYLERYGNDSRVAQDVRAAVSSWLALPKGAEVGSLEVGDGAAGSGRTPDIGLGARASDGRPEPEGGAGLSALADTAPTAQPERQSVAADVRDIQPSDVAAPRQPDSLTRDVPAPAADAGAQRTAPPSPVSPPPTATGDVLTTAGAGRFDPAFVEKVREAQTRGVGTPADVLVEPEEIAQRAEMQSAQRAEMAARNAAPRAPVQIPEVATPGITGQRFDPAALQNIPSVDGAPGRVAEDIAAEAPSRFAQAPATPAVDPAELAEAKAIFERWFDDNATPDVKAANDTLREAGDAETTAFRLADAQAVVRLLEAGAPSETANKNLKSEAMAYRYFSRYRDPGLVLSAMANDAAEARAHADHMADRRKEGYTSAKDGWFGPSQWTAANLAGAAGGQNIPLSPTDRLMIGLGRNPGARAMEWAQANLSPETRAELTSLMERRATKQEPGYSWINFFDRIEVREKTRGKRAGAKGTVDQALSAKDRESVLGEQARVALGFTREQWADFSQKVRQEHIDDHVSLVRLQAESRAEQWQALTPEERRIRQLRGDFSYSWPLTAHPHVGAIIRSGDFAGAVRTLAMTAPTRHLRKLAVKLLPRLGAVRSRSIPSAELERVRRTLSPETPTLGMPPSAAYVWPMGPAEIQRLRDNGHNEAADIATQYGGQALFDENVPISAELALHEALHAAADGVLTNPSHPLTRRLENLRQDLLKSMPATEYGLLNVRELLSEGMSNPVFRRDLTYLNTRGEARSARQRFKDIMVGFMRSLLGLPPRGPGGPGTARDLLDDTLNDILALSPADAAAGDVVGASFGLMEGARNALREAADRVRVPNAEDTANITSTLRDLSVPASWKGVLTRLFMPLDYVADNASKYFPTARKIADAVGQHQAEIRELQGIVDNTVDKITSVLSKYRNNQAVIDNFNRAVLQGTLVASSHQVDFRKPESTYASDPEKLIEYRRVRKAFDALPPDVQRAVDMTFALPSKLNEKLEAAIRERLSALTDGNKALQNKIYATIYNKIFAANLVDPYAALRRSGNFWVSYEGVDPETGSVELFKHAFQTEQQQQAAIRMLQSLESGINKKSIKPYMNVGSMRNRPQVPMEFVANLLDAIDGSSELANMVDPETGRAGDLKQKVLELMFDTLPETSFVNSFRKRQGTRGFIGDFSPFEQGLSYGDTLGNVKESNARMARQIADLRYGARFSGFRGALEKEFRALTESPLRPGESATDRARTVAEAAQYHDTLRDYTHVPFKQRGNLSRKLTAGTYMLTLGLNASTALITLSQIPLYVAPYLAGKHGMKRTVEALGIGHRLLAGSGRLRSQQHVNERGEIVSDREPASLFGYSLDNYDVNDPKSRFLVPLIQNAKNSGLFNHSLVQDQLLGENPTLWERISGWSGFMQHHAERYSREVSLGTTYILELQSRMGNTQSVDRFLAGLQNGTITPTQEQMDAASFAAIETSEKTNGPVFAAAGPLASQGDIGSILYLFKRHPLSMLNLLLQTAQRSVPWGKQDTAEAKLDQRIARRQIGGMMGMMALMAGAMGMPLMQQIGWLYDLFGEDDEPNFDMVVRMQLGELGAFGLVDFLTGLRISERIGLGSAIYRPGFAADQLPLPYQILEGLGGPVVGLGLKYMDRVPDLISRGEYWRAAEASMPTAFANMMRAYRFSEEGIQTMRGDPILGDVGPFSLASQALGFMSAEYSQRLAVNTARTRIDNAINTARTRLLQRRYVAIRENDWSLVRDIDQEIAEFNRRHPQNPITPDIIQASLQQHLNTSASMVQGVNITPRNRATIEALVRTGPSSWWDE